jgi:(p)ppGpp synthase/HD superfamily hydrolase
MTSEQLKVVIEQARQVAMAAHKGQTRRGGGDYFTEHVEQVAAGVEDRLKPIAYLHDVPEDTRVTLQDLIDAGFPKYVTDAVRLLTHFDNEPNVEYWGRIAKSPDAAPVKIKDMKNNLSSQPSEKAREKYAKGLALFAKAGYDVA